MPLRILSILAFALLPARAHAQAVPSADELAQVRDGARLEAAGDYAGAERVLAGVLERNPTSLSALLVLERVYQVQGRLALLLPHIERLLAADPRSAMGHQLLLRAYGALDRADAMQRAGEAWIRVSPKLETPYRELALAWQQRQEPERALSVLREGRQRVGTPGALALELGDAYLAAGDLDRAVGEWDRAIGAEGQGFMLVQRRLRAQPDGGAALVPGLVRALVRDGGSVARQRAALQLALDAGRGREAEAIARPLLERLPAKSREPFLADVARRADGADLAGTAYWAYDELIRRAEGDTARLLALRARLAQLALELGDTARAAAAYEQLERASAAGSPQRRQAVAVRIALTAREGKGGEALAALKDFRAEFPDAPELDDTAAQVSDALLQQGDLDAAERAVLGVRGPRSALARGRAFLRRGDLPRATGELMTAAPALRGAEGTRTIALAAVLTRMTPATGELLSRASARATEDASGAITELLEGAATLPADERAAVLEFAATLADDAALPLLAEQVRRELVEEHPQSAATPAALLWLARREAGAPEREEQARVLLERLILDHPRSALVPHARRELDRITKSAPATAVRKAGES